jgi:beta-RFAP synthase
MIRVRTASRLHFGLFSLLAEAGQEQPALACRQFGGVGLMIELPGIELTVERAKTWSAEGPLAARALDFARTYARLPEINGEFRICIQSSAPEHAGLGTGTQLALAVASALDWLGEMTGNTVEEMAACIGRGKRSAIGVHGFERGGFIVEAGKKAGTAISPLLVRRDFPREWRILLVTPRELQGTHGAQELDAFATLTSTPGDNRTTDYLCRLVLLSMLPALIEKDLVVFGEAVYEFNRLVGEMFRPTQGGVYSHSRGDAIVKCLRDAGVHGVGQSSWGPTIFAFVHPEQSLRIRNHLIAKNLAAPEEITTTWGCNRGARIESIKQVNQ